MRGFTFFHAGMSVRQTYFTIALLSWMIIMYAMMFLPSMSDGFKRRFCGGAYCIVFLTLFSLPSLILGIMALCGYDFRGALQ